MRIAALLLVFVLAGLVAAETDLNERCGRYTRCAECVHDAYLQYANERIGCRWCASTMTCSHNASCPVADRRVRASGPQCEDMQCSGARTTGNIYWCRGLTWVWLLFVVELGFVTGLYWVWMRAVQQLPWQFPGIHRAVSRATAGNVADTTAIELPKRVRAVQGACPMCHVFYNKTFEPGVVCTWCNIARVGFVPFVIGVCSVFLIFATLLGMSLRPSFADTWYLLLVVVPHAVYIGFFVWVQRSKRPIAGDDDEIDTSFGELAIFLKGRTLDAVFTIVKSDAVPATDAEPTNEDLEDSSPNNMSMVSDAENHTDTLQMLEIDDSIAPMFRSELKDMLRADEYIAWHERPQPTVILVTCRWLLTSFGLLLLVGVLLLLVGGISPSVYPALLLSPGPMRVCGFFMVAFAILMLAVVFSSIERHYVLTNRRLIMLSNGFLGSTHAAAVELADVESASIYGYQELGYSIMCFSWGNRSANPRRMPPVKMASFVGLTTIEELLKKFSELCDSLDSKPLKEKLRRLRSTWRLHIATNIAVALIAPVIFIAPSILPHELALFALMIMWAFNGTFIQRGVRVLSSTTAHLDLMKEWSRAGQSGFSLSRLMPHPFRRSRKPSMIKRSVTRPPTSPAHGARAAADATAPRTVTFEKPAEI